MWRHSNKPSFHFSSENSLRTILVFPLIILNLEKKQRETKPINRAIFVTFYEVQQGCTLLVSPPSMLIIKMCFYRSLNIVKVEIVEYVCVCVCVCVCGWAQLRYRKWFENIYVKIKFLQWVHLCLHAVVIQLSCVQIIWIAPWSIIYNPAKLHKIWTRFN